MIFTFLLYSGRTEWMEQQEIVLATGIIYVRHNVRLAIGSGRPFERPPLDLLILMCTDCRVFMSNNDNHHIQKDRIRAM